MMDGKGCMRVVALAMSLVLAGSGSVAIAGPQEDYGKAVRLHEQGDFVGAMVEFKKAADAGHVEAQASLGEVLQLGGESPDALKYYQMAADQGNSRGQIGLAALYAAGDKGVKQDFVQAEHWFRKVAMKDEKEGVVGLADLYVSGKIVPRDAARRQDGMHWINRSVELGATFARDFMLRSYARGNEAFGIAVEPEKGIAMLAAPAEAGDIEAMRLLLKVFTKGEFGFQPDEAAAKYWQGKIAAYLKKLEREQRRNKKK